MTSKDKGTNVVYASTSNKTETIAEWAEHNKFMEIVNTVVKKTAAISWTEVMDAAIFVKIEGELNVNPEESSNYLDRLRLKELTPKPIIKSRQIGLTAAMEARREHSPSRDCFCDTCKLYFKLFPNNLR